jgi:NADPH:quinone reductase-like Zn-dependent oxidoreductase
MFAVYVDRPDFADPLSALIVGERPQPAAGAGSVRIKVAAASLNWHDLWTLQGLGGINGRPETYPMILGCDGAGTLDDGTPVAIYPVIGDPGWKDDETLDPARSVLTEQLQGTFADYVALPRRNAVPLPSGLDPVTAAVLGASWLTAYRMLFTRSGLQPGQTMLVQGASGGVATALIQLGRAAGFEVWVTGRSRGKLQLAEQLGAQRCFGSGERLPRPADAVLELVGSATFEHSLASVRTGGCIVVAGAASGIEARLDLARVFIEQIQIKGVFAGTLDEFRKLLALVAGAGLRPHIGETLPMAEAAEGFRRMQGGATAGKILLKR